MTVRFARLALLALLVAGGALPGAAGQEPGEPTQDAQPAAGGQEVQFGLQACFGAYLMSRGSTALVGLVVVNPSPEHRIRVLPVLNFEAKPPESTTASDTYRTAPPADPRASGWNLGPEPRAMVVEPNARAEQQFEVTAPKAVGNDTPLRVVLFFNVENAHPLSGERVPVVSFALDARREPGAVPEASNGCQQSRFVTRVSVAPSPTRPTPQPVTSPTPTPEPAPSPTPSPVIVEDPPAQAQPGQTLNATTQASGLPISPALAAASVAVAGTGAVAAAAAVLANRDENWKLGLLAPFLGLFTRLQKPQVLAHDVRQKIHDAIQAQPGIHFNELRARFGLNIGALVHHLRTLERHQFVVSRKEGRFRRYYPLGARLPEPASAPLNPTAQAIMNVVERDGEQVFADLARRLDVSKQRLSYNVKQLSQQGRLELVERESDGRWVVRLKREEAS